jgi:hypothetical protein
MCLRSSAPGTCRRIVPGLLGLIDRINVLMLTLSMLKEENNETAFVLAERAPSFHSRRSPPNAG